MASLIQIVFDCHALPHPGTPQVNCLRLGIQEGKEVIEDTPYEGRGEIQFCFSLQVEVDPVSDSVVFKGKFVQGPRQEPFIYLCWGDRQDGTWLPCGRTKIPLGAVPRQQILRALADGSVLQARIDLTDGRGNPAFATLKGDHIEWVEPS